MNKRGKGRSSTEVGIIYLLHFTQKHHHARHYIGWTQDLVARLTAHHKGEGSQLVRALRAAGGAFLLARTWDGDKREERRLKKLKSAPDMCPICGASKKGEHK